MRPVVALAAISIALPVAAQQTGPLKGIELYDICRSTEVDMRMSCASYLTGFTDGFTFGQQLVGAHVIMCPQENVAAPQLSLMLQKAAREHPEMLNQNANVIVGQTLLDAFRCKPGEAPVYGR